MDAIEYDRQKLSGKVKEMKLFKYLEEKEQEFFLDIVETCSFEENEKIIAQGLTNPFLYATLEGAVNCMVDRAEKSNVYISTIGEGEVFGEGGLFLNMKRSANIIAGTGCVILRIERSKFIQFINRFPTAGIKMLMLIIYSLLNKLKESNQELAFERKSFIKQDDIDAMIGDFFKKP